MIVVENRSLKPISAVGLSILGSRHLAFAARFFGTAIWHDDGDNSRGSFAAGMDEFTRSSGGFDGASRPKLGRAELSKSEWEVRGNQSPAAVLMRLSFKTVGPCGELP